jgi:phage-related protein
MPNELYIMDQPDTGTAVNVLRINYMGIAFSQSGINGPYTTAWTIDSHFVADFITAGELNGNLIRAGSILASALEVAVQTIVQGIKMNFSFLNDGLHIAQKDEAGNIVGAYQTLVSDLGLRVLETASGNSFLTAEGDTVTANNLTADQYLRVRSENVASRFQQFYSTAHEEYEYGVFWEVV